MVEDEDAAEPPAAAPPPVSNFTAGTEAGEIENANAPDGTPPTDHDSCHAPMSPLDAVPDFDQFPFESVDPIAVPENGPEGIDPETDTGAFGVAPVMAMSHVSPT